MQALTGGGFGLTFQGIENRRLIERCPQTWPVIRVELGRGQLTRPSLDDDRAAVLLQDGAVGLDRHARTATFFSEELLDSEDVLTPHLNITGALFARWLGRQAFHAGGFVTDGGAWAVLGNREAGKSTMLAWLALAGHPILTDDLFIVDQGTVLAGPRFIDLREPAASALGCEDHVAPSRSGMRSRLELAPVSPEVPLKGWIFLGWDHEVNLRLVPPAQRLARLGPMQAVLMAPANPSAMLDLVALPVWELLRPRDLDLLPVVADRILDQLAG